MINKLLAIVIPAYKQTFLRRTLASIANQTVKDFTVYIGDDNSPHDLYAIVKEFKGQMPLVYKKFSDNVGGKDLVQQWNRCIDLIGNEEWIWLFSDDDVMQPGCVEAFYRSVTEHPQCDLFHFNVDMIDGNDALIDFTNPYPQYLAVSDFHAGRIKSTIRSYVIEYIFKKEKFLACGGFEHFDLAWSTDDATWLKIGREQGITTIKEAKVQWRSSAENITPNVNDAAIAQRKINSLLNYTRWQTAFFMQYHIADKTSSLEKVIWFVRNLKNFKHSFSKSLRMKMVSEYLDIIKARHLYVVAYLYFLLTDYKKGDFIP